MTRFVVDARTLLRVLERQDRSARPSVGGARLDPVAGHGPAAAEGSDGDLTEQEALAVHEQLTETKLRLLNDRVSRRTAWDIARQQGWDTIGNASASRWSGSRPTP